MTEKEAIQYLEMEKMCAEETSVGKIKKQMYEVAIKALEEVQEYKKIGTIKDFRQSMKIISAADTEQISKIIDEWILYHKIGTVEEVRNAVEKQKAKKVLNRKIVMTFHNTPYAIKGDCPVCNCKELMAENADYCSCCGQRMDWSGENE